MTNLLRNTLALVAGMALGGGVNMALITVGPSLIPLPAGVDANSAESLSKAMPLLEPRHYVMPFLAHAVGTFAGALAAYLIAASHKAQIAYTIGIAFLCGGVAASFMIPAQTWFIALDLLFAYLPAAWLAVQMATRLRRSATMEPS
ncbi:MAG TPA: hypothetical protein VNE58_15740 [Casimicrobiaceae bacterium]|nr:hypothetical protein [Casimicrobiaceae bacterium]